MKGTNSNADYGSGALGSPSVSTPLKSIPLPSHSQEDDPDAPSFVSERASAVMGNHVRGAKGSILADSFVKQIQPLAGKSQATQISRAVFMQALAFFSLMTFSGVTPTIMQALMDKDEKGHRLTNYLPFMPFLMDFIFSVIIGNLFSVIVYGQKGLKDCWNLQGIAAFAPVMFFAALSESLQMPILQHLDGTSWRIIKQLKLLFTAVGVYVFLGRRTTTSAQWIIILCVSISVFGYCLQSSTGIDARNFELLGVGLALTSIILTTFGGVTGDYTYKSINFPMCTQIAQGRLTSITVILIATLIHAAWTGTLHKFPFGGYTWRTLAFSPWLTLKDWTGSYVLKHLDSVWKCLAGVLSVCVAYFLDLSLGKRQFNGIALCFVMVVMGNIFAFALTKRDQAELNRARGIDTKGS